MPNPSVPEADPAAGSPVSDHGGDLGAARGRFAGAPEPWLDLSTGINPWPWPWPHPLPPPSPESWRRLPEPTALLALAAAAAACYGVGGADRVVAAPGSQALIQWLPRLGPPGRVGILSPTYAEHAASWAAAGHAVSTVADFETLAQGSWDTRVVVNPNNPDGRRIDLGSLRRLAASGGRLVVDEAFGDVDETLSLAGDTGRPGPSELPGLVVLRSFGKFFGLAGLRLGFALAGPALAAALRSALGPWPVSGPAVAIATAALADRAWIAGTRARLLEASGRLDRLLPAHGLSVVGGTSLFRLAATDDAGALWQRLGTAGILVRRFAGHPHWLRFGLPPDEAAWRRLAEALA